MNRRTLLTYTRILIFAPVALLGLMSPAMATNEPVVTSGLVMDVYNNFGYNQSPPLPSVSGRPLVGTEIVPQVQQNFDQSPPFGLYEDFIVHYSGYIKSPLSGSVTFLPAADDGTKLIIDGVLVQNDWRDKGGGGAMSSAVTFTANTSLSFDMWFYENGGGAWTTLYWDIGNGWEIVPETAFTQSAVIPTTTTTTIPKSLGMPTNVQLVDTGFSIRVTWDAAEDDLNTSPERYAISWSTGNSGWGIATGNVGDDSALNTFISIPYSLFESTGGLSAEYTITVRADNDTYGIYSPVSTAIEMQIGVSPPPPTTTTTSTTTTTTSTTTTSTTTTIPDVPTQTTEPEPETTIPVETTNPDTEVTETTVGRTTTPETTETTVLQQTEQQETAPPTDETPMSQEEAIAQISEIDVSSVAADELGAVLDDVFSEPLTDEQFTQVIDAVLDEPLTDEQLAEVVNALESDSVTEEQVAAAVEKILANEITENQATELATSEKVLQSIDGEQAAEIFDAIDISEITAEEAEQIVAAVQEAPQEVRESFEEELNVFDGAVDTYVPLGSSIPVGQRRVLIAIAAATAAIPVAPSRRR